MIGLCRNSQVSARIPDTKDAAQLYGWDARRVVG